mmetsp:Transcript_5771/g.5962  ORF Transcript_5771/g.5962 Transcript_5771/m.5962 type:complete len:168 (-) Transcript_5771:41-544(-)|eukprot:CAMPEP_0182427316 /NCGR_PEP_ID=MMETSP1167-20130531/17067_1 /TAXON_ID=2988 /ORGANISM="Mallomonas Sp, Strain CCMP3275" /LENGTH=167 /DNA_ID=CAMNT_0024609459 /DNA_START=57 /DNA_END=560 /DNA_ORIENTATION=+
MFKKVIWLLFVNEFIDFLTGFQNLDKAVCLRNSFGIEFQKKEVPESEGPDSFKDNLKRYIPGIVRNKSEKEYDTPQTDSGNRYQVRLLKPKDKIDRRHIATRIIRFFPGITYETAEEIIKSSMADGAAVIRVFNSKSDASYVVDMLTLADPPVPVDIFDTRKGEIVV